MELITNLFALSFLLVFDSTVRHCFCLLLLHLNWRG